MGKKSAPAALQLPKIQAFTIKSIKKDRRNSLIDLYFMYCKLSIPNTILKCKGQLQ